MKVKKIVYIFAIFFLSSNPNSQAMVLLKGITSSNNKQHCQQAHQVYQEILSFRRTMPFDRFYRLFQGSISEEGALAEALKNSLKETSRPLYGFTLPSPELSPSIFYLESEHQGATLSCGSRSLIHAKALEKLIEDDAIITSQAIKNNIDSLRHHINPEELEIIDLLFLSQNLGINNNIYYVQYKKDISDLSCAGVGLNNTISYDDSFAAIKDGSCPLAFYICNTGAHWVMGAARHVKGKVHIIYLNSLNSPLAKESMAHLTLEALAKKLSV